MDARLRCAVDANVGWYEDIFALHGIGSAMQDGLWRSQSPPPPMHSDAVVVEPSVTAAQILAALDGRDHAGFKDSFATLDMSDAGMDLLFEATWLYRPADPHPAPAGHPSWVVVRTNAELAEWTAGHDTADVLLPGILNRGHVTILAQRIDGAVVAGAVARLGSGVVDLSNVHAAQGHSVDWSELAGVVGSLYPRRPLVGYERGVDLAGALAGGFQPVGQLRVWVR